ncbi:hypothetical protein ACCQ10_03140 [Xanthomonas sp. NCPPB 1325]|uniref:hypothetical protein n=1 Tax=Xanthomonas sp. NCPPB 1325 TaxID=487529 RepID=UPI0035577A05
MNLTPLYKRAAVSIDQAIQMPLEQSDAKLQAANQAIVQEQTQIRQQDLAWSQQEASTTHECLMTISLPTHLLDNGAQVPFMPFYHYDLPPFTKCTAFNLHTNNISVHFKCKSDLSRSNLRATG